jgi:GAF domain-containing protein
MTGLPQDVVADLRQENARLLAELRAARDRQAGSAEILSTIAGAPGDAERALQQVAETTARLFGASSVTIRIARGDEWGQSINVGAGSERIAAEVSAARLRLGARNLPSTVLGENRQVHIPDLDNPDPAIADWPGIPPARAAGTRAMAGTPLRREGKAIGVLIVHRDRPEPFTAEELALQQSFADQAVIAIENARLFNETREALERQTATAEILKVIASSPSDVQPVFEAIATSANRLLRGFSTAVLRFVEGVAHLAAFTPTNPAADEMLRTSFPLPFTDYAPLRLVQNGETVQFADTETAPDFQVKIARARGFRSILLTPLMSNGAGIGLISVTRVETGSFADHHVQLLQTFADQAVIAIENVRLFNETKEALERQTATADILKVIASSPSDVQPVFEAIAERSNRLIGGFSAAVFLFVGDTLQLGAFTPTNAEADEALKASCPRPLVEFPPFELVRNGAAAQFTDTESESGVPAVVRDLSRLRGYRSVLFTPLMSNRAPIGMITVTRKEPGTFAAHHVQLLQTFADQAVIAIENVRLFDEVQARTEDLRESLQQQTATADVLKVISRSAFDLDTVLTTLVTSAATLCEAEKGVIFLREDDHYRLVSNYGFSAEFEAFARANPFPVDGGSTTTRAAESGGAVQVVDVLADPARSELAREYQRLGGFRTNLGVALRREGETIGVFTLTRQVVRPFTERQIELVQTFADQAVIAISNVRLFDEVQARTDDLRESLQQQTATAEVLKVISRSAFDLDTVMNTLARSASELCQADLSALFLRDGDLLVARGVSGLEGKLVEFLRQTPVQIDDETYLGRAVLMGAIANIPDFENDTNTKLRTFQKALGFKSILMVPLMREGRGVGVFALCRNHVSVFSQRQIELVQTFADQAVIAIENVRLFDEVQARTEDLRESLQQQTATADVLKVISRSTFDLQVVLDTLVESAARLCEADKGVIFKRDGDLYHWSANFGNPLELEVFAKANPFKPGRYAVTSRVALEGKTFHVSDVLADPEYGASEYQKLGGYRTILGVPLLREGTPIGVFALTRSDVRPFTPKQVKLVETFADQAVIAISNVRLFDEVQAKTLDLSRALQQQTATSDVLKVISRSAFDLQTVFDTLTTSASALCEADQGIIFLRDGNVFRAHATFGASPALLEFLKANPRRLEYKSMVPRVARSGQVQHIPDKHLDPDYQFPGRSAFGDTRAALGVPLLRDGKVEGVFVLERFEPGSFTDQQIELLTTFADQAVIAISNVRLFEEVQQRTKELSKSLDELRTAQDRLVQTEKLASLGQLTAGIAHEIKNPLNFVNNFSALSAELTDELNDVLKSAALTDKIRAEVDELTGLLKDNLEKVVQHGKRADSIVKNMLLHSREGSGDHRPADINALLDESLNLAYHGARAEKREFNVTLQRDFDEMAGAIEVFPQELTRVFLNLISNGFYAVTKRKTENGSSGFDPVLRATTRNLGGTVEIRIRDNGTGILAEVKEKMFNPFFTTKPAGEGTGLGLSMSHDIIVKQHGGTIDVVTEPGQFTEFTIVLPRTSNLQEKKRGQT